VLELRLSAASALRHLQRFREGVGSPRIWPEPWTSIRELGAGQDAEASHYRGHGLGARPALVDPEAVAEPHPIVRGRARPCSTATPCLRTTPSRRRADRRRSDGRSTAKSSGASSSPYLLRLRFSAARSLSVSLTLPTVTGPRPMSCFTGPRCSGFSGKAIRRSSQSRTSIERRGNTSEAKASSGSSQSSHSWIGRTMSRTRGMSVRCARSRPRS